MNLLWIWLLQDNDGKISFEEFCKVVGSTDIHTKMVVEVWADTKQLTKVINVSKRWSDEKKKKTEDMKTFQFKWEGDIAATVFTVL